MAANKEQKFIVAIGGTGMRCLESFVHLCAMGMFDDEEFNILTLDTDQNNGNKRRVEDLIENYINIKYIDDEKPNGESCAQTFFSAKLNLYRFATDYSKPNTETYEVLSGFSEGDDESREDNHILSDLFLDKETVQKFNLANGYRAQTHLGSHLMYHGIIDAMRNIVKDPNSEQALRAKDLKDFLTLLQESSKSKNARVFVFGSVFGGTGASSIPIIPVAFRDALKILDDSHLLNLRDVKFGATLLTEYFKFDMKDPNQKQNEKIVANSQYFALNSQAALQFYQSDPTVRSTYRRFYHVGWPSTEKTPVDKDNNSDKTVTGGAEQKNNCHVAELLCAAAAYDFFNLDAESTELKNKEAKYLFRSVEWDQKNFYFKGRDFFDADNGDEFEEKLAALFSLAHIILTHHQGNSEGISGTQRLLDRLKKHVKDYTVPIYQIQAIDTYFKDFAYKMDGVVPKLGWIYQIFNSIAPGKFIFAQTSFQNPPKFEVGDLYKDGIHPKWKTEREWNGIKKSAYETFIGGLVDNKNSEPIKEQKATTSKDQFLAHMYRAILLAQQSKLIKSNN